MATLPPSTNLILAGLKEVRLDELPVEVDEIDLPTPDPLDALSLPSKHIADLLVNAYYSNVHASIPSS